MKAIVKLGNGKYYLSKVFGVFNDNLSDEFKSGYKYYYIVFDEEKKTLITLLEYPNNLVPEILIYDNDTSDMEIDKNDCGKVNFLSDDEINNILVGNVSDDILSKCMKFVENNELDYIEIKDDNDIENFMIVSGNLHDGYIKETSETNNNLYVLFDGVWGCNIEMIFEGNVQYQNLRDEDNLWWFGSTIFFDNNEIVLVDDECYEKGDDFKKCLTWFKAEKAKYKVTPD